MGRLYAISSSATVSVQTDILEINAPADAVVAVHYFSFSQSTDAGDAQSEQLFLLVHRGSASGSGGSAPNVNPLHVGDPAFGGTLESWNTTIATQSTGIFSEAFNVMAGISHWWTPESRPIIPASGRLVFTLQNAPVDSIGGVLNCIIEEIGG